MKVTFDPAKRETTLANRGLDFADAQKVFEGDYAEIEVTGETMVSKAISPPVTSTAEWS
jgi:uncharacterized DUF497 family protein